MERLESVTLVAPTVIEPAVTLSREDPVAAQANIQEQKEGVSMSDRSMILLKVSATAAKQVGQSLPCPCKKLIIRLS
jgi:hypothetical protein